MSMSMSLSISMVSEGAPEGKGTEAEGVERTPRRRPSPPRSRLADAWRLQNRRHQS